MTRLMKILQIKGVIPNLLHGCSVKSVCTHLEFDRKHYWANNYYSINPFTHARNVKLEEQIPCDSHQFFI